MYAIVRTGGKLIRADKDALVVVEKLEGEPGTKIDLEDVLLVSDGSSTKVGSPFVAGAKVKAEIVKQGKGKKIEAFNYKPKKNVRKRWGHRQPQTTIKILDVIGGK